MKFSFRFSEIFQRYPVLTSVGVFAALTALVLMLTRRPADVETTPEDDVLVNDTLALNILCLPTLECLPLYHAAESGICDSLGLSIGITTEGSQFDIDSIMRRTRRIDGAVMDVYRMEHYRRTGRPVSLTPSVYLYGSWKLVTSGRQRIREISGLKKRTVATARYASSLHLLEQALSTTKIRSTHLYHAQINDLMLRTFMLDEAQIDAAVLPEPLASLAVSRGNRAVWRNDSVCSLVLCFRNQILRDERKKQQTELLVQAYNMSVTDLNSRGVHAADSALIKAYGLPREVIDTLRLPKYKPM